MCFISYQCEGVYIESASQAWILANREFKYTEASAIYERLKGKPIAAHIRENAVDGVKSEDCWWVYNLKQAINTPPESFWNWAFKQDYADHYYKQWFANKMVKELNKRVGGLWDYYWED